jgi:hypothetical protein
MPSTIVTTTSQRSRLIGLLLAPAIVDVRIDEGRDAAPRLVLGSARRRKANLVLNPTSV